MGGCGSFGFRVGGYFDVCLSGTEMIRAWVGFLLRVWIVWSLVLSSFLVLCDVLLFYL